MSSPFTQVTVSRPCAESWAAMAPATGGRHCAACQQVVVDFTQKTDAEVLTYLAGAAARPCGRFRPDQLRRPLHPAAPVSRWRAWLGAVLALGGVLGAGRAAAQARSHYAGPLPEASSSSSVAAPPAAATQAKPAAPPGATRPPGPLVLRGTVSDARSGELLPGAIIRLAGTARAATDAYGRFELPLADTTVAVDLSVSYIGYDAQHVAVAPAQHQALAIQLHADTMVLGLGETVVVPGRRPWPCHPRTLYHWTRYRVRRLLNP